MPLETVEPVFKKNSRKATRFSVMLAGQAGLGKTSLLATVFDQTMPPSEEISNPASLSQQKLFKPTTDITTYSFELEHQSGVCLLIDAIDTPGFGDDISPQDQADFLLQHLEKGFDDVFEEEQRIRRNPKFKDHRVHVLLYFIEPTELGLKRFDVDFMRHIGSRVNIIPVLAKADGFGEAVRETIRSAAMDEIARNNVPIYDFSQLEGFSAKVKSKIPFLVSGAIHYADGSKLKRTGSASSDDVELLKTILLDYAREDLKEHTEDTLYEEYRTEKLLALGQN